MITSAKLLRACWIGLVLSVVGLAPAFALPYPTFDLFEYPSPETVSSDSWEGQLFPDLEPGVVRYTEFGEERLVNGQPLGILTLICSKDCYVSVIHYSPAGQAYVVNPGIRIAQGHQVSVSFKLPRGQTEGLTLFLAWDTQPDQGWLSLLAKHPNRTTEPVRGVLATGWFKRSVGGISRHPWEGDFDNYYKNPPVGFSATLPELFVGIDTFGKWRLKDCSTQYNGNIQQLITTTGFANVLELSVSQKLILEFNLPGEHAPSLAWLYLLGTATPGHNTAPTIEVIVNNWSLTSLVPTQEYASDMQPIGLEVSHFLQAGYNLVEVKLAPATSGPVYLDNIELWVN